MSARQCKSASNATSPGHTALFTALVWQGPPSIPCAAMKFTQRPCNLGAGPGWAAGCRRRSGSPLLAEAHHHVDKAAVVLEALHGAALGLQREVGRAHRAGSLKGLTSFGRQGSSRSTVLLTLCSAAHSQKGFGCSNKQCASSHVFTCSAFKLDACSTPPASSSPAWAPWGSGRAPYRHEQGSRAPYLQAKAGSIGGRQGREAAGMAWPLHLWNNQCPCFAIFLLGDLSALGLLLL